MIIHGLILCAILWAVPSLATDTARSAWDDVPTVDLTGILERAEELPDMGHPLEGWALQQHWLGIHGGPHSLVTDLDGNGDDELLRSLADYFGIYKVLPGRRPAAVDQRNVPRQFGEGARNLGLAYAGLALAGPYQLDGDDQLEILAVGCTADRRTWGFWTTEFTRQGETFRLNKDRSFFLPHFPERRPDDIWDGYLSVVDTLNGLLHEPERSALVLSVRVGFDVYGRGIMAVDPMTGKTLWHFQSAMGPSISSCQLVDVNGDGAREVVFVGTSPCNLDDEKIGEYTDDHTRLFVLDRQGKEQWSCRLAGPISGGFFAVDNFNGIPGMEIVSCGVSSGQGSTDFFVWNPQGELVTQSRLPVSLRGSTLLPAEAGNPPSLVCSTQQGQLIKLQIKSGELQPVLCANIGGVVALDILPPERKGGGPRLAALVNQKHLLILDPAFRPLAAISNPEGSRGIGINSLRSHGREYLLSSFRSTTSVWEITANPDALPTQPVLRALARTPRWAWLLIVVTLLALAGWLLAATKHRAEQRRRTFIPVDSDHMREARLHLLEDLELSGHGAIAPLRSLRRLLWLLDALQVGFDMNEGLRHRFGEILTDCHQDDLPRLLVILERAQAAGIQSPQVGTATEALQNIQAQLARMKDQDLDISSLQELSTDLRRHSEVAETALQSLRHDVADEFQTNLCQVVDKVLRANAQDIERQDIKVQVGQMAQAAGGDSAASSGPLICRMDPFEMEFILDNLVGNAIRAMDSADTRRLHLTWQTTNNMIKMQVKDTGLGIAVEDRDSIMETDFSTKERGGMGLPRSGRLLRKYGGQLSIAESSPGQGTTFQLLLPRAK